MAESTSAPKSAPKSDEPKVPTSPEGIPYQTSGYGDQSEQVKAAKEARSQHSDADKEYFKRVLGDDWDKVTDPNEAS